jgi:hypothetical protein
MKQTSKPLTPVQSDKAKKDRTAVSKNCWLDKDQMDASKRTQEIIAALADGQPMQPGGLLSLLTVEEILTQKRALEAEIDRRRTGRERTVAEREALINKAERAISAALMMGELAELDAEAVITDNNGEELEFCERYPRDVLAEAWERAVVRSSGNQ